MRFDGVVFDLDGTLLDSLHDIAESANFAIESLGYPPHPIDAYQTMVGDGVSVLFDRALPAVSEDASLRERCFRIYQEAYEARWHNRSKPYDGILPLLEKLRNAKVKLAILSNKPDAFTQKCASHFFQPAIFDLVLGSSARFPHKPDPSSARWIGSQFGVDASRIAYVGDTNTDMKTALGAGFYAIGVTWGFRPESELRECGAHGVVHTTAELEAILFE